jgi:outer membrane protein assembly factor BamA
VKITIAASLSAKWNMYINASQLVFFSFLKLDLNEKMKSLTINIVFSLVTIFVGWCKPLAAQTITEHSFRLLIQTDNKDTLFNPQKLNIKTQFSSASTCSTYIKSIPSMLHTKGYAEASVDDMSFDSTSATIQLHLGYLYNHLKINADSNHVYLLKQLGLDMQENKEMNWNAFEALREQILTHYENNGHPFASAYLKDIQIDNKIISATLSINEGPSYKIDSIRIIGNANISNYFIQKYLGIPNKSLYCQQTLNQVDQKIKMLPFVEQQIGSDIQLLGTGSVLNLYLKKRKTSQFDCLIGLLPANSQSNKTQLTGDIKLNLKNSFGRGETILLNWQQLQIQSPRLNIGYEQPYIFHSSFGIALGFDLFKKDSSFLQTNASIGVQYLFASNQSGKLFFQQQHSTVLESGIDTFIIKATKQLPSNADIQSTNIGIEYFFNNTNDAFNPRRGNEIKITGSIGLKKLTPNSAITKLKDPTGFDYNTLYDSIKAKTYQFRIKASAGHYFKLGKFQTIKTSLNAGLFQNENLFRNELFQIGGFRLLRGFDEESIYATAYGVLSAEWRFLIASRSYLYAFTDGGVAQNKYLKTNESSNYTSAGMGISMETKSGLLNIAFALGKKNEIPFDFKRAAKIHIGFINYF